MDIQDLNKQQLILLTLLITFVVSIATGIVTVSLMQQVPKSVPQTINNVIQRTIEKVSTVPAPNPSSSTPAPTTSITSEGTVLVPVYAINAFTTPSTGAVGTAPTPLGQGVLISDSGLVMADGTTIGVGDTFIVALDKTNFSATVIKRFSNGIGILKLSPMTSAGQPDTSDSASGTVPEGSSSTDSPTE